jgi:hypothetical protein
MFVVRMVGWLDVRMVDHCRCSDVRGLDGWMFGCSWFGCPWFGLLDVRMFVVRGSDGWMVGWLTIAGVRMFGWFGCSWMDG